MKPIFYAIAIIFVLTFSATGERALPEEEPSFKVDSVAAMIRAIFLDPLNDQSFRSESNSFAKPTQFSKGGAHRYVKYRLTELPQKKSSGLRVFDINEARVKFNGDDFVAEEMKHEIRLKYVEETGEIYSWRLGLGWKPIEEHHVFGKSPRLKNFKPQAAATDPEAIAVITEKPFTRVVGFCYDFRADKRGVDSVFADGSLHRGIIQSATVQLDEKEIASLVTILTSKSDVDSPQIDCYYPHHAFVFYDAESNVVASIDICVQCHGAQVRSLKVANSLNHAGLHKFIERVGLPILRRNDDYSKLFRSQNPGNE